MEKTPGPKPRINVFGYLDETGLLHTPSTDKVFGFGLLICTEPRQLHRAIIGYKNQQRFYGEFKFTDIRTANVGLYKGLADLLLQQQNVRFISIFYDKKNLDMAKYNHDHERAYSLLAARLVSRALTVGRNADSEYLAILADDVSTSKGDKFERIIKGKVKEKLRRNAVFGIARLESHAISELQFCDVLLGTVAYAFKIKFGLVKAAGAKLDMVKHLQKRLGVKLLSQETQLKFKGGVYFIVEEHNP